MIAIDISTTTGGEKIARLLKVTSPHVILSVVGARFLSYVDQQFKSRGEGRWRPLAASTLALRRRGGDAPLQDTGRYRMSFTPAKTDNQSFVEVGSNVKTQSGLSLAKIHELGTGPFTIRATRAKLLAAQTRGGVWLRFGKEVHHPGIPARPVLPSKAVAERMIRETVDAMIQKAVDGSH